MVGFVRSMPVLEVADVALSEAFYVEKLGFTSHGSWGDETPLFCIVQRGQVTLALDKSRVPRAAPLNQYWAAYLYVSDADELAAEFRSRGVELVREPCDMEHGLREFGIRDPDGHIIAFGHPLRPAPHGPGLAAQA
jgi:predicted enzyme related to lactoylglutathione lyase